MIHPAGSPRDMRGVGFLLPRDWRIFLGSMLIGNVYWTLACFMGISLVEWVWGWLAG